jgi:AraC-like DNA-binding protein
MPYLGQESKAKAIPMLPKYWVHFKCFGDGTEWIDANLPQPNYFYRYTNANGWAMDSYCIGYYFEGMFNTRKATDYLNDIIRRFIITLPVKERLMYRPSEDTRQHTRIYHLKDFQNLSSIPRFGSSLPNISYLSARHNSGRFWETKLWIEQEIKRNGGEGNIVSYDSLFAVVSEFYEWKDRATCKAFCSNLWNWYDKRDWEYHIMTFRRSNKTKEEILMTRVERAKSNARANEERAYKKVINLITGLYADEYKKKNGAWHIGKISEELNMSRNTVSKHIKAFEQKNRYEEKHIESILEKEENSEMQKKFVL